MERRGWSNLSLLVKTVCPISGRYLKIIDEFAGIECRFARSRARLRVRRRAQGRTYYAANREARIAGVKKWQMTHPDKNGEYKKKTYLNRSLHESIARRLRGRLHAALKHQGVKKTALTFSLLGCSSSELKTHLEKQFLPGMTWDNFGLWHIDHILPCISFAHKG